MPYVPQLQRSREIGSAMDMVNSSPILQGHMVCSTPLLCGVKVCQCIPHHFQYAPSSTPDYTSSLLVVMCGVTTNTGHVWSEGK